jgi:hypothetical protein
MCMCDRHHDDLGGNLEERPERKGRTIHSENEMARQGLSLDCVVYNHFQDIVVIYLQVRLVLYSTAGDGSLSMRVKTSVEKHFDRIVNLTWSSRVIVSRRRTVRSASSPLDPWY